MLLYGTIFGIFYFVIYSNNMPNSTMFTLAILVPILFPLSVIPTFIDDKKKKSPSKNFETMANFGNFGSISSIAVIFGINLSIPYLLSHSYGYWITFTLVYGSFQLPLTIDTTSIIYTIIFTQHTVITLWGTGVGAAIFTNGTLYRGAASSAGEWGHNCIIAGGRRCRCGSTGMFEAYIGAEPLLAAWRGADPQAALSQRP